MHTTTSASEEMISRRHVHRDIYTGCLATEMTIKSGISAPINELRLSTFPLSVTFSKFVHSSFPARLSTGVRLQGSELLPSDP